MRPQDGGWGVPDFGTGIRRDRLVARLSSYGTRPTVVTGSSGAGKSFLAAQFVGQDGRTTLWLNGEGVFPRVAQICDLMERLTGSAIQGSKQRSVADTSPGDLVARILDIARAADAGSGVSIVLDDAGPEPNEEGFEAFQEVATALWRAGTRLLVTTRSIGKWPATARCAWAIVDEHDLALDIREVGELAARLGTRLSASDLEEICDITGGHVALCAAMSVQAARHGLTLSVSRVVSLEAWLERAVAELPEEDLDVARLASALKVGSDADLARLGVGQAANALRRVSTLLPLLRIATKTGARVEFRVHDLVDGYFAEHGPAMAPRVHEEVLTLLVARGDFGRACELLVRLGDDESSRSWLAINGSEAFAAGHVSALDRLLSGMATSLLMSEAATLVLWSRVCYETGRYEESVSRARAARLLAEHERDWDAVRSSIAQVLSGLRHLGRHDEADALAEEVISSKEDYVDEMLLAEALFCVGCGCVFRGDLSAAEPPLRAVLDICETREDSSVLTRFALNSLAVLPCIVNGDYQASRRALADILDDPSDLPSVRIMIKGNMAWCLAECGRMERAESLVRAVVREAETYGLNIYLGAYLPVLGLVHCVQQDTSGGLDEMRRGIALSISANDGAHAAVDRLWLSQVLRAVGRVPESLCEAEASFEVLSSRDDLGFKRSAGLEVAASLLASHDPVAARNWVASTQAADESESPFHNMAASMILAECDRLEGAGKRAIERLAPFAGYVRSENPNLLLAMYCRAFPSLTGLVALAVGVANLPVHMLRMIPPESAEMILVDTHSWLDDEVWRALGTRLLGEEEFAKFLARDGLPVCHVHFFGGLEVSIGGRSIREKDWRKRKARLLCAMLVLAAGPGRPARAALRAPFRRHGSRASEEQPVRRMEHDEVGPSRRGRQGRAVPVLRGDRRRLPIRAREHPLRRRRLRQVARQRDQARGRRGKLARLCETTRDWRHCTEASSCPATSTTTGSPSCASTTALPS